MIYLNDIPVVPTVFPDGTSQVWKLGDEVLKERVSCIKWDFASENEFLQLAQLKDLLDAKQIIADLHIDFLPYGRQDKEVSNYNTFALTTFAKLLNSLNFARVYCIDPHSNVAERLIKNFIPTYPLVKIKNLKKKLEADLICYPDSGAKAKYTTLLKEKNIFAMKYRNQQTGLIEGMSLVDDSMCDIKLNGEKVLIVDDICDGGMTFILLAKKLYEAGAKDVNLFVTHGIFSKGLHVLYDAGIEKVFTNKGEAGILQGNLTYKPYGDE